MPVTLVRPIAQLSRVEGLHRYLADPSHANHQEYNIEEQANGRHWDLQSFSHYCSSSATESNAKKKTGRPMKTLAWWLMIRFPDWAWLSRRERFWFGEKIRRRFAPDGSSVLYWHNNRLMGSSENNLLFSSVDSSGNARRTAENYFRRDAIFLSDALVSRLNRRRRALQLVEIVEMPNRIAEIQASRRSSPTLDIGGLEP